MTLDAEAAWGHEEVYHGSEKIASIALFSIRAACAAESVEGCTYADASPSTTRLAMQADVEYSEETSMFSRLPSSSMNVLVTDCVTATLSSGTPKYL